MDFSLFFRFISKNKELLEQRALPICRKYDINYTTFKLIIYLSMSPEFNTAKDICEISDLKKGIVSVVIENLSKRGWIKQVQDKEDRRKQRLFLTDETAPLVAEGKKMINEYIMLTEQGITAEEQIVCDRVFNRIYENLLNVK